MGQKLIRDPSGISGIYGGYGCTGWCKNFQRNWWSVVSLKQMAGADPGEVKWVNFHPPPPFFEPPSFFFFSYPSNIEIIFDFSDIITKIHPPIQNPGSALGWLWQMGSKKEKAFSKNPVSCDCQIIINYNHPNESKLFPKGNLRIKFWKTKKEMTKSIHVADRDML